MSGRHGFSILEIAIVLIIVGLVTGGILMGGHLLEAVRLKSVSAEHAKYRNAIDTFVDKYYALPGDMPNATEFWGRADTGAYTGNCGSTNTDTHDSERTCSGDGDGTIDNGTHEMFRFWEHLKNAELITGQFNGVGGGAGSDHEPGTNSPLSGYPGSTWGVRYFDASASATEFQIDYRNYLSFGSVEADGWADGDILTPVEAYEIDQKFDDGKPAQGLIISAGGYADCTLAANSADLVDDYDLTEEDRVCSLAFRDAF